MRIVLAILSFAVAATMLVLGIGQRTFLALPDRAVLATTVETDAPVTVIAGEALNAFVGRQTITVAGGDQMQAAYGRSSDVLGWVGDASYNLITLDENGELASELVSGSQKQVPSLLGSDLWYEEFDSGQSLTSVLNVPADVSFVVIADGVAPAPASVTLRWPLDNSTPWAGPLIVGGGIVALIGLIFLLWATYDARRSGGPRRKQLPKVPKKRQYKPGRKALPAPGRRAISRSVAASVLLIGGLALAGCSAQFGPGIASQAAPTPTPTLAEGTIVPPVAATQTQVERIVERISATVTEADAARDAGLLATRMGGAALELRAASYAITAADSGIAMPPAVPAGPVKLVLPQQTDAWPRTVLAIIQNEADAATAPVALFLEQASARENYKVSYSVNLEPSVVLPDVAPADIGTSRLADDSPLLRMTPQDVALAYADILAKDVDSASYLDFEPKGDSLRTAVGQAARQAIAASLPSTASVSFGQALGAGKPIVMATNDAGALVVVNLNETQQVVPTEEGAAINPTGAVKALSGVAVSTKGVIATYSDQLLFYVPPVGADGKIVLLGYSQGLIKASEIG